MKNNVWRLTLGLGVGLCLLTSIAAAQESKIGVAAGVNPAARGIPPVSPPRVLYIGQEVVRNERIQTEPQGQAQLQFLDRSTLTIGPSSEVVLDEFVYAPATDTGRFAMAAGRGVMRFVGGAISKGEEVTVATPAAVIGIRGGAMLLDITEAKAGQPAQTTATFLAGIQLRARATNGEEVVIRRPGFSVTIVAGQAPRRPTRASLDEFERILSRLEGRRGTVSVDTPLGGVAAPGLVEGRVVGAPAPGAQPGRPPGADGRLEPGLAAPGTPGAPGGSGAPLPGQTATDGAGTAINRSLIDSQLPAIGSDRDPGRDAARTFDPTPAEGGFLPPTLADDSRRDGMVETRRSTVMDLNLPPPPPPPPPPPDNGFFVPPLPPMPPPAVPPIPPTPPTPPQ